MATITGKRFQITDGASTPTNLFPYTVSEAVYGLSNTISNAISTALSALSLSTYAGTSQIGSATQPVYYNGSALVATNLSTTYAPYNSAGYLPLTGGTLKNGNATVPLYIDTTATYVGTYFCVAGVNKAWVGYYPSMGVSLYSEASSKYLGIKDDGTPHFHGNTLWHSGNSNLSTVPWACSTLTASDHIYMANNKYLYRYDSGGVARSILDYESNGTMLFCWGNATGGYSTSICGNTVSLRYGTSHTIGMTMDTSGNVGIGTTSPLAKLHLVETFAGDFLISRANANGAATLDIAGNNQTTNVWRITGNNPASGLFQIIDRRDGTEYSRFAISTSGNVGIGTVSPSQKLHVEGSIYAAGGYRTTSALLGLFKGSSITSTLTENDGALYYYNHTLAVWANLFQVDGDIVSTGDQVISSDLTLKENLTPVTYSVADIAKARAVEFDWKDGRGHSMGSIAQDWLSIAPALVHGEEGNMSLAYGQLALVNTVIEAREIEALKARVAELEAEVKRLRMN